MEWLQKFMYGRHGPDQLSIGLFVLFLILSFVDLFIRGPVYLIIELLTVIIAVLSLWRMFSRNNQKRWDENQKFVTAMQPLTRTFQQLRSRWKDRKTYRYYHCPKCKATLRVPRGRGKICIKCPVCKNEFIKKA